MTGLDPSTARAGADVMTDTVVTSVLGQAITMRDMLVRLKIKGQFRAIVYEIIEAKVIGFKADEMAVRPGPDDMAARLAERRRLAGLANEADLTHYLRFHGIVREQLDDFWRVAILRDALKLAVIPHPHIKKHFDTNRDRFATVTLARIACADAKKAAQAMAMAQKDEESFVAAARLYSNDESVRFSGGYLGHVRRGLLAPEIERVVFQAKANSVVGPFRENSLHTVYKIHAVSTPKLDERVAATIRDQLFEEWLRKVVSAFPA